MIKFNKSLERFSNNSVYIQALGNTDYIKEIVQSFLSDTIVYFRVAFPFDSMLINSRSMSDIIC